MVITKPFDIHFYGVHKPRKIGIDWPDFPI